MRSVTGTSFWYSDVHLTINTASLVVFRTDPISESLFAEWKWFSCRDKTYVQTFDQPGGPTRSGSGTNNQTSSIRSGVWGSVQSSGKGRECTLDSRAYHLFLEIVCYGWVELNVFGENIGLEQRIILIKSSFFKKLISKQGKCQWHFVCSNISCQTNKTQICSVYNERRQK